MNEYTTNEEGYTLTRYVSPTSGQCSTAQGPFVVNRSRTVSCPNDPNDYTWNGNECVRNGSYPDHAKNAGGGGPSGPQCTGKGNDAADPCNAGTGNEFRIETDYRGSGLFPLTFTRTYNAMSYDSEVGNTLGVMGTYWQVSYLGAYIQEVSNGTVSTAFVHRPDGKVLYFTLEGSTWTPDSDVNAILTQTASGWTYTLPNGTVETYGNTVLDPNTNIGNLLSITDPAGLTQTLAYNASGQLASVTDPFGHSLTFTYNASGQLATMTDPNGDIYKYSYDSNNNLSAVTYPDGKTKTYLYDESGLNPSPTAYPHLLTGITDQNGNRYVSIYYNTAGQVIETTHPQTTNSVGQQQRTLSYATNSAGAITSTTVTDAAGNVRTMNFGVNLGVSELTSETVTTASGVVKGTLTQDFDANNNLVCQENFAGQVTTYTYDATNQMVSKTEGQTGSCGSRSREAPPAPPPTRISRPNSMCLPPSTARVWIPGRPSPPPLLTATRPTRCCRRASPRAASRPPAPPSAVKSR